VKPILILLVEDDEDVFDSVSEELLAAGYEVAGARTAAQALAYLKEGHHPSAMLIDFMMPDATASALLDACRADPQLAGIPALVMSAARPRDLLARGVERFLQKPFHPDKLQEELTRLLQMTS